MVKTMSIKKSVVTIAVGIFLAGCAQTSGDNIHVVTREVGSGTRGAFTELFNVEYRGADGSFTDLISIDATIANGTGAVITTVSGDESAIGYITLGSLSPLVRPVTIDGIAATTENILNGSYTAARPFNIAFLPNPNSLTQDFINFIMSEQGQAVIADHEYVPVNLNATPFTGGNEAGSIVVGGSTAVTPLMEHLVEAYLAINQVADIEIQMMGSSAGMTGAIDQTLDIGMASRPLNQNELEQLTNIEIAIDGLVIVVNNENPIEDLPFDAVRAIFSGELTNWSDLD